MATGIRRSETAGVTALPTAGASPGGVGAGLRALPWGRPGGPVPPASTDWAPQGDPTAPSGPVGARGCGSGPFPILFQPGLAAEGAARAGWEPGAVPGSLFPSPPQERFAGEYLAGEGRLPRALLNIAGAPGSPGNSPASFRSTKGL